MPTATRDGVRLYYEKEGDGSPPMVFVHGWTCDHSYFVPQVEHFRKTHSTVTLDLRGHGMSDPSPVTYGIDVLADDVAWLCETLKLDHPVIMGHSLGGAVVLELAARHPALPRAIVTIEFTVARTPELTASLHALVEGLHSDAFEVVRDQFIAALFLDTDDRERREKIIKQMSSCPQEISAALLTGFVEWDGRIAARALTVPALHISATGDADDTKTLQALNPLFQSAVTVGAGHFNQLFAADQVNAMVEQFLRVSVHLTP
ncbi:MAG TPA: alpha/beta hydrolase [Acidimicrobiales bacterium]|nr:alpha/beta hydrolase [Acidimicrobiales bacterium]